MSATGLAHGFPLQHLVREGRETANKNIMQNETQKRELRMRSHLCTAPKQANIQTETDEHCRGLGGLEETTLGRCRALPEGEDFSGADKSILGPALLTIPQLRKRSKSH